MRYVWSRFKIKFIAIIKGIFIALMLTLLVFLSYHILKQVMNQNNEGVLGLFIGSLLTGIVTFIGGYYIKKKEFNLNLLTEKNMNIYCPLYDSIGDFIREFENKVFPTKVITFEDECYPSENIKYMLWNDIKKDRRILEVNPYIKHMFDSFHNSLNKYNSKSDFFLSAVNSIVHSTLTDYIKETKGNEYNIFVDELSFQGAVTYFNISSEFANNLRYLTYETYKDNEVPNSPCSAVAYITNDEEKLGEILVKIREGVDTSEEVKDFKEYRNTLFNHAKEIQDIMGIHISKINKKLQNHDF